MSSESTDQNAGAAPTPAPTWTYPTRFCRICREDVVPTVTMYPPGVPPRFQKPLVEYKNDDEYGRLIKPCKCSGSMRYIHELCLLRSRVENRRADSMWRCHTCGHQFNFQKLAVQRWLSSRYSSGVLTAMVMLVLIFILGFIADPIINFYIDPYETLLGEQGMWDEVSVETSGTDSASSWKQHFIKGLFSMGLVGFLKTILVNPLNWLNLRHYLGMTGSRTTTTGRDRALNIGWITVVIGVVSAFYFFYQWVQTIIQLSLKRVGNNIVDTQLPGDDDDLKPPPGWGQANEAATETSASSNDMHRDGGEDVDTSPPTATVPISAKEDIPFSAPIAHSQTDGEIPKLDKDADSESAPKMVGTQSSAPADTGRSSALDGLHEQGWSFVDI